MNNKFMFKVVSFIFFLLVGAFGAFKAFAEIPPNETEKEYLTIKCVIAFLEKKKENTPQKTFERSGLKAAVSLYERRLSRLDKAQLGDLPKLDKRAEEIFSEKMGKISKISELRQLVINEEVSSHDNGEVVGSKILHTLREHSDWVNSAVFSPDGKYVATASSDKTAPVPAVPLSRAIYITISLTF